jgi:2-oxoisovalerate dehydrogenase E1 component alpha subunit
MDKKGWWDDKQDSHLKKDARVQVLSAFNKAEARKKPPVADLFSDVYAEMPKHLQEQKAQLDALIKKYPDHYSTTEHAQPKN